MWVLVPPDNAASTHTAIQFFPAESTVLFRIQNKKRSFNGKLFTLTTVRCRVIFEHTELSLYQIHYFLICKVHSKTTELPNEHCHLICVHRWNKKYRAYSSHIVKPDLYNKENYAATKFFLHGHSVLLAQGSSLPALIFCLTQHKLPQLTKQWSCKEEPPLLRISQADPFCIMKE